MNPSDQLSQQNETHKAAHLMEALGVLVLAVVVAWLVTYYFNGVPGENLPPEGGVVPPPTREELIEQMSERVQTSTVSPAEREKLIQEMSERVPATGAIAPAGTEVSPTPTVSSAERQKLIDAMKERVP